MRRNNYKIAALLGLIFAGCLLFFKAKTGDDVWRVIGEIPPSISREKGIDTSTYYIIRQTHEPLFRCDDLQNYTSRVLKSWGRSVDYRKYSFYPDTSRKFTAQAAFSEEYFKG